MKTKELKSNKSMRTGVIFAAIAIITLVALIMTFAKYASQGTGEDDARVAKWGLDQSIPNDLDLFDGKYTNTDGSITVESKDGSNVIAPGTSKTADIFLATFTNNEAPEVMYHFEPSLTISDEGSGEKLLDKLDALPGWRWTLGRNNDATTVGEYKTVSALLKAVESYQQIDIPPNVFPDTKSIQLGWEWDFDDSGKETWDASDTELGNLVAQGNLSSLKVVLTLDAYQCQGCSSSKKIAPPTGNALTYDTSSQIGVNAGTGYTLSTSSTGASIDLKGNAVATDAGTYTATATLEPGYTWKDGTTGDQTITWTIAKAKQTLSFKLDPSSFSSNYSDTEDASAIFTDASGHGNISYTLASKSSNQEEQESTNNILDNIANALNSLAGIDNTANEAGISIPDASQAVIVCGAGTKADTYKFSVTAHATGDLNYEDADSDAQDGTWTVNKQTNPLTFTAAGESNDSDAEVQYINNNGNAPNVQYSVDNANWSDWAASTPIKLADVGGKIYVRGDNASGFSQPGKISNFSMSGSKIEASGDVMSLVDNGACSTTTIPNNNCFFNLFNGCKNLTSAPDLPATTLTSLCYSSMFAGCTSLVDAPEIPATTLASYSCQLMFSGCTALTSVPENLPATSLESANDCYIKMFKGCTALTSVPENFLPATALSDECYNNMFSGCTSLTNTPTLNATTLAESCYGSMFEGCSKLDTVTDLPAEELATGCYFTMFRNCISLKEAPSISASKLATNCCNGMFLNCQALEKPAQLSAEELADNCYVNMFQNCYVLELPSDYVLPATKLTNQCYSGMFKGCEAIKKIPEKLLDATELATQCYESMFSGCTSLISIPENLLPATTLKDICYRYMFSSCTSLKNATKLNATYLPDDCYKGMFSGDSSLNVSAVSGDNWIMNFTSMGTGKNAVTDMFEGTGGSFTGTPVAGTDYYWN